MRSIPKAWAKEWADQNGVVLDVDNLWESDGGEIRDGLDEEIAKAKKGA